MTITFFGLREVCPALDQFERAGKQAAETGWSGWIDWLRTFAGFNDVIEEASHASGVSFGEARRVVLDHLAALFADERRRLAKTTRHEPAAARTVPRVGPTADHRPRATHLVPEGRRHA